MTQDEQRRRRQRPWGRRSTDRGQAPGDDVLGCEFIDLPKITDPQGNLTFIENSRHVPFDVQRVYYLYDVPGGEVRGGHAHRTLQQLVIAVNGSFDVVVDDGRRSERFSLRRSHYGLYLPPMVWHDLDNFSSGSVAVVLASQPYDEGDYFREYEDFQAALGD